MKDSSLPFVSIVTVNFNGRFFLKTLFNSIAGLKYPQEKLQVIMVDNGSTDGSDIFVKENYPFIEVLSMNKNLGFAGGNNAGAKSAKGDYIAFINNDCEVGKEWLLNLVNAIKEKEAADIKIGGAGSKVLFYFKYLPLKISINEFDQKNSRIEGRDGFAALIKGLKIIEDNGICSKNSPEADKTYEKDLYGFANKSFKYLTGFHDCGRDINSVIIRKIKNEAVVWVPIADMDRDMELEMTVSFIKPGMNLKISLGDEDIYNLEGGKEDMEIPSAGKSPGEPDFTKATIRISSEKYILSQSIINSCGSMINRSFYAKEINYEKADVGFSQKPFEVFALPGSSFIINKNVARETGLFDEKFFTYYEDIDLFWRAMLKGWKFFAVPDSVARHFHCGTGEEWSYSFTYHVLRNRLLMIYRCCWVSGFLKNYFSFCASALINLLHLTAAKARRRDLHRPDISIRARIFFEFFILMILQLGKRFKIRAGAKNADSMVKKWQRDF
jgi:GT2 family glycosyltransferase